MEELTDDEYQYFIDSFPFEKQKKFPHYIGGYSYFINDDPRIDNEINLVQIGDSELFLGGTGNFNIFIKKEDLINLNFSNAWCDWDCI